jgi:DNA-binding SARP family transcriptional activator
MVAATYASLRIAERAVPGASTKSLRLLSGFELVCDEQTVRLPPSVQRLLVFLTVQECPRRREHVSGMLWLESTAQQAGANLRSALWRLNQLGHALVELCPSSIRLSPEVRVDLRERSAQAHALLDGSKEWTDADLDEAAFSTDLLPDWYDDWLVIERERFHQLRLRVLESICERLIERGKYASALSAGLAAVAAEPLRESAHRAVVKVHLAEDNFAEAIRQFELYRRLVNDELGLEPTRQIIELIRYGSAALGR